MSTTPTLHAFTGRHRAAGAHRRLRELAHNLWWSWHPECHQLFSALNPAEWERSGHNPVAVIEKATKARLLIVAHDQSYLRLYKSTMEAFDAYMGVSAKDFGALSPERRRPISRRSTA